MKKIKEVEVDYIILATIERLTGLRRSGEHAEAPVLLARHLSTHDSAQTALYDVADACRESALDDGESVSTMYEDRDHIWYEASFGRSKRICHFWLAQDLD